MSARDAAQRAETEGLGCLSTGKPGGEAMRPAFGDYLAELRWRYTLRAENEPRIKELESILGKPESGK